MIDLSENAPGEANVESVKNRQRNIAVNGEKEEVIPGVRPERPKEKEVNRPTRQGHEARTTRQRVGRKSHEMAPRDEARRAQCEERSAI